MSENIVDIYPLSPMQQGMLFHSLYSPEKNVYVEQLSCTIHGSLSVSAFERAWQQVLDRHTILRTAFVWEDLDEPLQVVQRDLALPFVFEDWQRFSTDEQNEKWQKLLENERQQGFNLARPPLMRVGLFQLNETSYRFVWTFHHLLLDGWSLAMLLEEVFRFYDAFSQEQTMLGEPAYPYRDYIAWLQQQDRAKAEQYWRRTLAGFNHPTQMRIERPFHSQSPEKTTDYDHTSLLLSPALSTALKAFARDHQLTLNTIMQAAWGLLLSYYSQENDIVFGATVSGRPPDLPGVESMVGLFINTLPVRLQLPPGQPLLDWLQSIQQQQAEQRQFEFSALTQIQGWSDITSDVPLFESILVFENYPVDQALPSQTRRLEIGAIESYPRTNYPLTFVISPGECIGLEIAFESTRYETAAMNRLLNHLQSLLQNFLEAPQQSLSNLTLLTPDEIQDVCIARNQTQAEFPATKCLHHLFEEQVKRHPDNVALVFENKQLTYQEFNTRANQLAHYLKKMGVGPEVRVGLCVDRSPEMLIGMFGILKAGGAYLPLDPQSPPERLFYIMQDAGISVLLTQAELLATLSAGNLPTVCLDRDWPVIAQENNQNPSSPVGPENLAYVIYTSGSTGRPKGTMIPHTGLVNHATTLVQIENLTEADRAMQFLSISFDAAGDEIFPTLINGATLVLHPNPSALSVQDLLQFCGQQQITILHFPVGYWQLLVDEMARKNLLLPKSIKLVVFGGESPSMPHVHTWSGLVNGQVKLINAYGPTEATIVATLYELPAEVSRVQYLARLPIGQPINNVQIYLLNQFLQPVPLGVPGELYIGGAGVGRGYLNRPEQTAAVFLPDPFSSVPGRRLYRTGDLACYRPDGTIDFLGRVDNQIKLRGFRIELQEIELILQQHPAVQRAAVVVKDSQNSPDARQLVAFWEKNLNSATEIKSGDFNDFLKQSLPDYMIPALYVQLEALPLTPSGKIDRRALPAPELQRWEMTQTYIAPRTPSEEILAGIFSRVLGVEKVGVHDNFWALGGHSLRATQLVSRLQETFQIEFPLRTVFEKPTVAELGQEIEGLRMTAHGLTAVPLVPVSREAELPLSFAQQRLWFLDQLDPNSPVYNIPVALRLEGDLNIDAFKQSLRELINRHESLRTTFPEQDGQPVQVIAETIPFPFTQLDLSHYSEEEREAQVQQVALEEALQPFNLSNGPLLRIKLLELKPGDAVILLTMHHIISDGWSVGVLIQEFTQCYAAFCQHKPSPLPELPLQYADFAHWQRKWLSGEVLEKQMAYWRKQLANCPPLLELPIDFPRPAMQTYHGDTLSTTLPAHLLKSIHELCQQTDVTLFMLMLAAWQTLLFRYTNQTDLCVGTPIANRNRVETENLIGFFVNTLVLRTRLEGSFSFLKLLEEVRTTALEAYAHQDIPFEMLVEVLQPPREMAHSPFFQVMLVLQNAPLQPLALPELKLTPILADNKTAKFDLTLIAQESSDGLMLSFEYNTDLFAPATIQRMFGHFKTLLTAIVDNPDQSLAALPVLTPPESIQLLEEWNQTAATFPRERCVHTCFEELAQKIPTTTAVRFEEQHLTYLELNARANQLAHYLRDLGVKCEDLVGIFLERSPEIVVSILGILKAGAAFVPLDPAYPPERLAYMLDDSAVKVLLTQEILSDLLPPLPTPIVQLDLDQGKIQKASTTNPEPAIFPENLAYVIYTSGSTGKPKGTMLTHRGLCNLATAQQRAFDIHEGSRILQFSSLSFDAAVWETVMALLNGGTLCLAPREELISGQRFIKLLQGQQISAVTLPPSYVAVMPSASLPDLKVLVTAGEKCTSEIVVKWGRGRRFFNAYGPTETTVCASMFLANPDEPNNPPIGKPIQNFQLYVVDAHLQPVPVGVPGELLIGGVGLGRGYLKRPELTAEKFIPNPFSKEPGARLYRSGDLVRYQPDGNIEFLGRIDQQVKIRGFRIELGEIETILRGHPDIRDTVVMVQEDIPADKRLIAYFIPENGIEVNVSTLRQHLRQSLPEYMVPVNFIPLEQFPVTPSGKIDRNALPAPDQSRPELETIYVAPRNPIEEKLATICAELLALKQVGIHDNFFDLGGHSLLATQFLSRIKNSFQIDLPLRRIFEKPTIAELALEIEVEQKKGIVTPPPEIKIISRRAARTRRTSIQKSTKSESQVSE